MYEGAESWVPFREMLYQWRRNKQGQLGYHLWAIKPTGGSILTTVARRKAGCGISISTLTLAMRRGWVGLTH